MSIMRTALPLVLLTGVLTGCAGLQKTDWPTCAALGGVTGAAIGATESSAYAGYGALLIGGMAGAYLLGARRWRRRRRWRAGQPRQVPGYA